MEEQHQEIVGEQPLLELQKFVWKMEDYDWGTDTTLCRENQSSYTSFYQYEIVYFKKKPFLKIDYENTNVAKHQKYNDPFYQDFNFELLESATNIWAFYYINSDKNNLFRGNGMIEDWKFETNEKARLAEEHLKDKILMTYYSDPFVYVKDNHVIIFHTMGNLLTPVQKELFEKFKKYMN